MFQCYLHTSLSARIAIPNIRLQKSHAYDSSCLKSFLGSNDLENSFPTPTRSTNKRTQIVGHQRAQFFVSHDIAAKSLLPNLCEGEAVTQKMSLGVRAMISDQPVIPQVV